MIEVHQTAIYAKWFAGLKDTRARARIDIRIRRLSLGNPGDVKPVGKGYRVYFVQHGHRWILFWPEATNPRSKTILQRR